VTELTEDKQCIKLVSLHAYIEMHGNGKGKGHPITGHKGPRGGVEV
jgi:hypothetical protein